MNIDSVFEPAQAYVMLSRVQCLDQLFIVSNLDPTKIRTSTVGMKESLRLDRISMNKNENRIIL